MTCGGPSAPELAVVFERVLDQALACGPVQDALDRAPDGAVDREQLRLRAVRARTAIAAAAEAEYRDYARLLPTSCAPTADPAAGQAGARRALPPPAVLLPGVSAVVAAAFLLTGYGLRAFDGHPYMGDGFLTAGLLIGALAVGAAVADVVWLWATGPAGPADTADTADTAADRARQRWERALLERGVVPFLLGLVEAAPAGEQAPKGVS
ncbi:hypothetical protein AB0E88_24445 [Streptomyces sp. NPDC028635]|uniref:hypothetical protein n=1 Tax=Streptomyces sp. NPDC028635 TaxID=3154800 RepID=UPI0033E70AD8